MQRAHQRELYYVAPNKVIEDSLGPDFLSVEPGFQLPGAEFPILKDSGIRIITLYDANCESKR